MSDFKGDYMGFTYNGEHSSSLGIVRVSDGSRFSENLLPTLQDKTVQIPGGDGTYYFGSYYTQRQFSIAFAFDNLTEERINKIKMVFGDKKIHDLIFDENPYKIYSAKVTGSATLKYIPFSEDETNRIYKGEGSIQFTCFQPFARCAFSNKDIASQNFSKENLRRKYTNIDEWWEAAAIQKNKNFGNVPVPFKIKVYGSNTFKIGDTDILSWELPEGKEAILDTKIGIAKDASGEIYNEYIFGDLAAKIPVGAEVLGEIDFTCLYF